jgi:hypothetical protein
VTTTTTKGGKRLDIGFKTNNKEKPVLNNRAQGGVREAPEIEVRRQKGLKSTPKVTPPKPKMSNDAKTLTGLVATLRVNAKKQGASDVLIQAELRAFKALELAKQGKLSKADAQVAIADATKWSKATVENGRTPMKRPQEPPIIPKQLTPEQQKGAQHRVAQARADTKRVSTNATKDAQAAIRAAGNGGKWTRGQIAAVVALGALGVGAVGGGIYAVIDGNLKRKNSAGNWETITAGSPASGGGAPSTAKANADAAKAKTPTTAGQPVKCYRRSDAGLQFSGQFTTKDGQTPQQRCDELCKSVKGGCVTTQTQANKAKVIIVDAYNASRQNAGTGKVVAGTGTKCPSGNNWEWIDKHNKCEKWWASGKCQQCVNCDNGRTYSNRCKNIDGKILPGTAHTDPLIARFAGAVKLNKDTVTFNKGHQCDKYNNDPAMTPPERVGGSLWWLPVDYAHCVENIKGCKKKVNVVTQAIEYNNDDGSLCEPAARDAAYATTLKESRAKDSARRDSARRTPAPAGSGMTEAAFLDRASGQPVTCYRMSDGGKQFSGQYTKAGQTPQARCDELCKSVSGGCVPTQTQANGIKVIKEIASQTRGGGQPVTCYRVSDGGLQFSGQFTKDGQKPQDRCVELCASIPDGCVSSQTMANTFKGPRRAGQPVACYRRSDGGKQFAGQFTKAGQTPQARCDELCKSVKVPGGCVPTQTQANEIKVTKQIASQTRGAGQRVTCYRKSDGGLQFSGQFTKDGQKPQDRCDELCKSVSGGCVSSQTMANMFKKTQLSATQFSASQLGASKTPAPAPAGCAKYGANWVPAGPDDKNNCCEKNVAGTRCPLCVNLTTGVNYTAAWRKKGCDAAAAQKIEAVNNATNTSKIMSATQTARSSAPACAQWQAVWNDPSWTKQSNTDWGGGKGWAAWKGYKDDTELAGLKAATNAIMIGTSRNHINVREPAETCYFDKDETGKLRTKAELAKMGRDAYDPAVGKMLPGDSQTAKEATDKRVEFRNWQMSKPRSRTCDSLTADYQCPGGWRDMTPKEQEDWLVKSTKVVDKRAPKYTEAQARAACSVRNNVSGLVNITPTSDCIKKKLAETQTVTRDMTAEERAMLLDSQKFDAFYATDLGKSVSLASSAQSSIDNVNFLRDNVWDKNAVDPATGKKGAYRRKTDAEMREIIERDAWTSSREYDINGKEQPKSQATKALEAKLATSAWNPIDGTWTPLDPEKNKTQIASVQNAIKNCHFNDGAGFFEWCGGGKFGLKDPRYTDKCCGWGSHAHENNAKILCDWKMKPIASSGPERFMQCEDERFNGEIFNDNDHKVNVKWPDGTPYGNMTNDNGWRRVLDYASQIVNPSKAIANRARTNGNKKLGNAFDFISMVTGSPAVNGVLTFGKQVESGQLKGGKIALGALGVLVDPTSDAQHTLREMGHNDVADALGYVSTVAMTFVPGIGPEFVMARAVLRGAAEAVKNGTTAAGKALAKSGVFTVGNNLQAGIGMGLNAGVGYGLTKLNLEGKEPSQPSIYYDKDGNPTIDKVTNQTDEERQAELKQAGIEKWNAIQEYNEWQLLSASQKAEVQAKGGRPPPKP